MDRDQIRTLPLFRDLARATQTELMQAGQVRDLRAHTVLMREGKRADDLIVVIRGNVELYCNQAGRETTTDIIFPKMSCGLAAIVCEEVNLNSARTLAPCQIFQVPATSIRETICNDPVFARAVATELAGYCRHFVELLKGQKLQSGAERLANWILETDRQQGSRGKIVLSYDKRTLAAYLGMVPESLSRNFASLADHGVVSSGRELVITNREALRQRAKRSIAAAR